MVARRAHNPEVVWFKSHLRNQKRTASAWMLFFFAYEVQTPNHLRAAPAGRMGSRRTKQTTPHTFPRDPVVTSPTSATKKGTASAWMLFLFAYEVQTPNHLRAAPAGRMGSRRTKQTASHTFPRDPVVTSPTSATKKGTASAWMLFFFAYEVQTPNHLRAAPAGRMGSRRTKQTTSHTFPRDPVVTSPTSATKKLLGRSSGRFYFFTKLDKFQGCGFFPSGKKPF